MGLQDRATEPRGRPEQDDLAAAARQAMASASLRLGIDAVQFAGRARNAELAEVILELRLARHSLADDDKTRVEALLRHLGVLP